MPNICPSLLHIRISKNPQNNIKDENFSDYIDIFDYEKLTQVKRIKLNTNITLSVRILCCHNVKNIPSNYCTKNKNTSATKQLCTYQHKPKNIHFHIYPNKDEAINPENYFLAFVENTEFLSSIPNISTELSRLVDWLNVDANILRLYIFTFGEPIFQTRNIGHIEHLINESLLNNINRICSFSNINITPSAKEQLTISLRNKELFFVAS
jgi:hypothetical protein